MDTLLEGISWTLGRKKFESYETFTTAVAEQNPRAGAERLAAALNRSVAPGPVTVSYEMFWRDDDDHLEVEVGHAGEPVTAGLMLFTVNNATLKVFAKIDHKFFEGFAVIDAANYELLTGS